MNFVVFGLGSMGKRRIRLIKKIVKNAKIFGVDLKIERALKAEKEYQLNGIFADFQDVITNIKPHAVIVCSSPLEHLETVKEALEIGVNTFSEINLSSDGYNDIIKLANQNNKIAFLSSTLLYRKEIKWIKENYIRGRSFYRYHVGQYLPDWHPWESYKDYFVGKKETNACREIMAIEFPWIIDTFGEVEEFHVIKSKKTELEIEYPDVYQILFKHKTAVTGCITIDLVSRKAESKLEIISEKNFIKWEGTPETLFSFNKNKKSFEKVKLYDDVERTECYQESIIENAYESELLCFIRCIKEKKNISKFNYEDDQKVLDLINKIEES